MPDNIDSISIELTADTSSAEESLNKLIGRLALLKVAVQGASNFTKIAGGIQRIADAARKIETDSGEKLSNLAHGLMELSKVGDMSNLGAAAKNLSSVIKAASSSGNSANLGGLANGIRGVSDALGGIKDADVSKLNAVKDALSGEMSGSLHSSTRASESATLGGMGSPEPSFGNMAAYGAMTVFKYVADSIRDATSAYHEFTASLGSGVPPVFTEFVNEVRQAKAEVLELESTIKGLLAGAVNWAPGFNSDTFWSGYKTPLLKSFEESQNFTFGGGGIDKSNAIEIEDLGESAADAAAKFERLSDAERFANFSMKPLEDEAENTSARLRETAEQANSTGSFFSRLSSAAKNAASHMRLFGKSAKNAGDDAEKGTSGMSKFLAQLKRVAYYRFIRMILREIAQAFKEGATNLYQWSKATGASDFAKNMDRIATSVNYLKNSLGAMLEPIVRILTPIIEWITDALVWIIDKVSQFFAALTGADTYTAAKKVATTWSDASDNVAGSTKKAADNIKRTILGFDEINKLEKQNTSSYGGGSGSNNNGTNVADMFEEKPLEGWAKGVSDFVNKLGDWISKISDWFSSIFGPIKQLFTDAGNAFDDLDRSIDAAQQQDKNVNIKVNIKPTAQSLWDTFTNEWNSIKGKILFFQISPTPPVDLLFNMISKAWDEIDHQLTIDVSMKKTWANQAYEWLGIPRNFTINVSMAKTWANQTYEWLGIPRNFTIDVSMAKTWANQAYEWLGIPRNFTINVSMAKTWANQAYEWLGIPREFTISIKLDYVNDGKPVESVDGFEGASGGGGRTSGGGAGRISASTGTNGFGGATEGFGKTSGGAAGRFNLIVTPTIDSSGWEHEWDAFAGHPFAIDTTANITGGKGIKKVTGKAITLVNVSPSPVKVNGTTGTGIDKLGTTNKLNVFDDSNVTVNGNAGTGFKSFGNKNKMNGFGDSKVKIHGVAGTGLKVLGATNSMNGFNNSDVVMDAVNGNGLQFCGAHNELNPFNNSEVTVDSKGGIGLKLSNTNTYSLSGIEPATVTVNGGAGTGGFKDTLTSDNKYQLTGITETTVGVKGGTGSGGFLSTLATGNKYQLQGITSASVGVIGGDGSGGFTKSRDSSGKYQLTGIAASVADVIADITANAHGGKGTYLGTDNKIHLDPITGESTSVSVGAVAEWASTIGGLVAFLGLSGLSTDITANGIKGWGSKTFKAAVDADDTTSNITAILEKLWGTKKALDYLGLSELSTTIKVGLKPDDSKIKVRVQNGEATLESATKRTEKVETKKALGGVFSNGRWSRIPQYANGTTNAHGSLFLAGEAGPEIVGHVGGRTEVLNKSQLASAMFSAVRSAMQGVQIDASLYGGFSGDSGNSADSFAEYMRMDAEEMRKQNELLRQQNELLRQINDKEFTAEVSTMSFNKAQRYANKRSGQTIVPVTM